MQVNIVNFKYLRVKFFISLIIVKQPPPAPRRTPPIMDPPHTAMPKPKPTGPATSAKPIGASNAVPNAAPVPTTLPTFASRLSLRSIMSVSMRRMVLENN